MGKHMVWEVMKIGLATGMLAVFSLLFVLFFLGLFSADPIMIFVNTMVITFLALFLGLLTMYISMRKTRS